MQVQSSKTKNTRLPYSRPLSSSIPHLLPHFLSLFVVQQQFLWVCAGVTCTCMPLYTHMNRLKKYRLVPFNSPIFSTIFVSPYLLLFFLFPFVFIGPPSLLVFHNAVHCFDILNPGFTAVLSCSHCQCILTLSTVLLFVVPEPQAEASDLHDVILKPFWPKQVQI